VKRKAILLDIETQVDFFRAGGSCYTKDARPVVENIYRLFAWARAARISVISTVLRLRRGWIGPLADVPHCVEGTKGERKLSGTVLSRRINLGGRNTTDLPRNLLRNYQQVIFEKRSTDIFHHTRLERLITELPPSVFVVCGAGVAHGIVQAVIGLRRRGFDVIVVEDAILDLPDSLGEMAMRRMDAKGAIFARTCEIVLPNVHGRVKPLRTTLATGRSCAR